MAAASTDGKHACPVVAAEPMEAKPDLVRLLNRAISKASKRKRRRPHLHPTTKKRMKTRNASQ